MRPDQLHVVCAIGNPVRYASRWRLYRDFARQMRRAGVALTTVELLYGARTSEIADAACECGRHIVLQSQDELWHKENLLNIGIAGLPDDWRYAAWIDADVTFQRPDWAAETVERLQTFDVLQLFSHVQDMGPDYDPAGPLKTGFAYSWWNKLASPNGTYNDPHYHPGFAWAMRREAYEAVGGLLDFAILGSADYHMATSLIGRAELSLKPTAPVGLTHAYKEGVLGWQELAQRHIRRNLHYVPGLITHAWHGRKKDRRYGERWKILCEHRYSPLTDIRRDHRHRGLIRWAHDHSNRMQGLRDDVRRYLRARNEDSVDLV